MGGGRLIVSQVRYFSVVLLLVLNVFRLDAQAITINGGDLTNYISPTGLLPPIAVSGVVINCCGTLNINTSYNFVNCTINMCPCSSIEVLNGNTLALTSTVVQADPVFNQLWHRIRVHTGATLKCGPVATTGSAPTIIRDAQFAVEAMDKCLLDIHTTTFENNWIGIFSRKTGNVAPYKIITMTDFFGNLFIQTAPLLDYSCSGEDGVVISTQQSAAFPTLVPNRRAIGGIVVWNLLDPNYTFPATSAPNVFNSLDNGIISNLGGMTIANCEFGNIRYRNVNAGNDPMDSRIGRTSGCAIYHDGGGFVGTELFVDIPLIISCNTGVYCRRADDVTITGVQMDPILYLPEAGPPTSLMIHGAAVLVELMNSGNSPIISNNHIQAERFGVQLSNNSVNASIQENFIEINDYIGGPHPLFGDKCGIIINSAQSPAVSGTITGNILNLIAVRHGIRVDQSSNWIVNENICNVVYHPIIASQIGIIGVSSQNIIFDCNASFGFAPPTGPPLPGGFRTAYKFESLTGSSASCNSSHFAPIGFYIKNTTAPFHLVGSYIGDHWTGLEIDNSTIGDQFNLFAIGENNANRWFNTTPYGGWGASTSSPIISNRVQVSLPDFIDQTFVPSSNPPGWFGSNFLNEFQCIGSCPILPPGAPEPPTGAPQLIEYMTAMGDVPFTEFAEESNWKADAELFAKILQNPEMASPGSVMEAFKEQKEQETLGVLGNIGQEISTELVPTAEELQSLGELFVQYHGIKSQLSAVDSLLNTDSVNTVALQTQRLAIIDHINEVLGYLQSLRDNMNANFNAVAQSLTIANDQVSDQVLSETNQKRVNEIYLSTVAISSHDFTEEQLQVLLEIGLQCPLAGGPAVYEVRSIYTLTQDYDFVDDCITPQSRKVSIAATPENLVILPNPSQWEFGVLLPSERNHPVAIYVYNALGDLVAKNIIAPGNRLEVYSCATLSNGTYSVRAMEEGLLIGTSRLVVIH